MPKIIPALIAAVVICGCTEIAKLEKQTVAAVLAQYGVESNALLYRDEPPGKLQAVSFQKEDSRIVLVLDYNPTHLFSKDRNWNKDAVLSTKVIRILTETPIDSSGRQSETRQ